jgi:hypothetical protein
VRENDRVVSKALMIAYGTNDDGKREILGFSAYRNESRETWKDFLTGLKKRGLCGLMMITSDGSRWHYQCLQGGISGRSVATVSVSLFKEHRRQSTEEGTGWSP